MIHGIVRAKQTHEKPELCEKMWKRFRREREGPDSLRRMLGRRKSDSGRLIYQTNERGEDYARIAGRDLEGKTQTCEEVSAGPEGEGDSSAASEGGMKATIPDGEHPFDYLFEGHQFLMAGCLLLEEVEVLEEEELEQMKKLLDPYAERIREFWLNVGEREMIDSERRERGIPISAKGNGSTSLPGRPRRFLRVLYEGGKPYPREAFDWNVALTGSDRTGERERIPRGPWRYQRI